jgi:hypothetical protein
MNNLIKQYEKILNDNKIILHIKNNKVRNERTRCGKDINENLINIKFSLLQDYNEIMSCLIYKNIYYNLDDIIINNDYYYSNKIYMSCKTYIIYKIIEYIFYNNKYSLIYKMDIVRNEQSVVKDNDYNFYLKFGFNLKFNYNEYEYEYLSDLNFNILELNFESFIKIKY